MSDFTDFDGSIDPTGLEHEASTGGETAGGDNPAWAEIRSQLDETTYGLIKPHLAKFDSAAQQRIESLNKQFGWAKQYIDGGRTPEQIDASLRYADMLSNKPVEVFQNLASYLQQHFPQEWQQLSQSFTPQQLAQQVQGDPNAFEDEEVDPRIAAIERQNAELLANQQRQAEWFAQQEAQRQQDEVNAYVTSKFDSIRQARPDLQDEHWQQILGYAAGQTELRRLAGQDQPMELEEAVQWFDDLKNQFLTAPRPGDSAPDLLPLGGGTGNPAQPQRQDYSKMSDNDIVEMIARDMAAKNQRG